MGVLGNDVERVAVDGDRVLKPPTDVLGVGVEHSLGLEPVADLKVGDREGPGAAGDSDRVANVIAVAMGDEDEIRLMVISTPPYSIEHVGRPDRAGVSANMVPLCHL